MAKQEIEMHGLEVDELSKDTLDSYAKKASQKIYHMAVKAQATAKAAGELSHANSKKKISDADWDHEEAQHAKAGEEHRQVRLKQAALNTVKRKIASKTAPVKSPFKGFPGHELGYYDKMKKNESEEIDEMVFGSIVKTLSKYGKGVPKDDPKDDPKKVSRSTVHTDYTMTGHKEKKTGTGRVYTKVLSDYDDDAPKAAKATQAPDQVEAPKRGRGRPAGALNKNGSGVTGKGWSAESKAAFKAKLAAKKAEKLAALKNESEELEESFAVVDHKGKQVHVAYSESSAKKKAEELSKSTGNAHTVKFDRTAMVKESELDEAFTQHAVKAYFAAAGQKSISPHEFVKKVGADKATEHLHAIRGEAAKNGSTKFNVQHDRIVKGLQAAVINAKWGIKQESITEEDWSEIIEGGQMDAIVEFMMDEEYQSLDELSKKTLGSYIKKSSSDAASLATNAMHLKNTANMHADASREAEKQGDQLTAVKRDQQASDYHDHSFKASHKQYKRLVGVRKAADRLTKESVEIDESIDLNIQRYAAMIGKNLIKE